MVACQIRSYGQFSLANATQNGLHVMLIFAPSKSGMLGGLFMALVARVVFVAALEPDGNNILGQAVMFASCLVVDGFSPYNDAIIH